MENVDEQNNSGSGTSNGAGYGSFSEIFNEDVNKYKPGNIVKGTVTQVTKEVVVVDIGFKSEGIIPSSQFVNDDGEHVANIGDQVEVFIMALENEDGQVVLSREKAYQKRVWNTVENTLADDGILRGKVIQKVKGGLQVDIGIPAFLPGSQVDIRPHRNLDKFLGEIFDLKVLKITRENGNIVVSRKAVLVSERDQLKEETLKVLSEGVVMEGVVKNITEYGVFVDLGGVDGLVHITDVSWGRVNHPSEKVSVGQTVPVVVLKYDEEKQRVSLGMKQLKEDPWLQVAEKYPVGSKVNGKVIALAAYGAFVELEDGVEGLVHVSEMSWTKKINHPSKVVSEGQEIEAVVLEIDPAQRKINLGMKQATPNPWEEVERKYPVGSVVDGVVRKVATFGIFVGTDEGVDGLVKFKDLSWTKHYEDVAEVEGMYKVGDAVKAVVLGVDVEAARLSLGIKQLDSDPWETMAQKYPVGTKVNAKIVAFKDFGVFVEIEPGVEGLIRNNQLGLKKGEVASKVFKVDEMIEAEVARADKDIRKLSLRVPGAKSTDGGSGTLGEFMQFEDNAPETLRDLFDKLDTGE